MSIMPITPPLRPKLGLALEQLVGNAPMPTADLGPPMAAPKPGFLQQGGTGRAIAGSLGDVLMQFAGLQPTYAPAMRDRRQAEAAEAQWGLHRQAENEDWQNREAWKLAHPDPSPIARDVAAWQSMTPEQRVAFGQMKEAQAGDPDVVVTLPNGQLYIGKKSGLAMALGGGIAPTTPPPKSELTPITGGPGGSPSGAGFPWR